LILRIKKMDELFLKDTHRNTLKQPRLGDGDMISHQGRRGRDRMVVGFTTTCATSANHHLSCEL
jgi:hypothetical protein